MNHSERLKGHLTFLAFATTYSAGSQFQVDRSFICDLTRLSEWILATIHLARQHRETPFMRDQAGELVADGACALAADFLTGLPYTLWSATSVTTSDVGRMCAGRVRKLDRRRALRMQSDLVQRATSQRPWLDRVHFASLMCAQ
jgi:hypothetical protein